MLFHFGLVMGIVMMETTIKNATLMAETAVDLMLIQLIALNVSALNEEVVEQNTIFEFSL